MLLLIEEERIVLILLWDPDREPEFLIASYLYSYWAICLIFLF